MCLRIIVIIMMGIFMSGSCEETLNFSCLSDSNCSSFSDRMIISSCKKGVCSCYDKTLNDTVECIPKRTAYKNKLDKCPCHIPNSQCDPSSNMCVCRSEFIASDDEMRCIPAKVGLQHSCEINLQCVSYDSFSYCNFDKHCECLQNYTQHDNACHSLVKMGEKCEGSEECQKFTKDSICLNHDCVCEKSFVASNDGNFCLPYAYYGDNCTETKQCTLGLGVGSVCDSHMCVCDSNHKNITEGHQEICQRFVFYGDKCKDHSDCVPFNAEATMICSGEMQCTCREGFELFDADSRTCVVKQQNNSAFGIIIPNIFSMFIFIVFTVRF